MRQKIAKIQCYCNVLNFNQFKAYQASILGLNYIRSTSQFYISILRWPNIGSTLTCTIHVPMSEPCWTLVQCWTNIGPNQKQISPTVALEAKTGQMSDAHLPSTALTKIGPIKSKLELHGAIFSVGSMLTQHWTNV